MKVISLRQPWALLVVLGHKKIETRSWKTTYRGDLLIHASQKEFRPVNGMENLMAQISFEKEEIGLEVAAYSFCFWGESMAVQRLRFMLWQAETSTLKTLSSHSIKRFVGRRCG